MAPAEVGGIVSDLPVLKKADWTKPEGKTARLAQVFFNVNMAKQHGGLRDLASEYDIDLDHLVPGQYVGFLNRKRTKIKLFTCGNIFAYLSFPSGSGEISMETIAQIPTMFLGSGQVTAPQPILSAFDLPIPQLTSEREAEHRLAARRRILPATN